MVFLLQLRPHFKSMRAGSVMCTVPKKNRPMATWGKAVSTLEHWNMHLRNKDNNEASVKLNGAIEFKVAKENCTWGVHHWLQLSISAKPV
jgi:hypothetical protein